MKLNQPLLYIKYQWNMFITEFTLFSYTYRFKTIFWFYMNPQNKTYVIAMHGVLLFFSSSFQSFVYVCTIWAPNASSSVFLLSFFLCFTIVLQLLCFDTMFSLFRHQYHFILSLILLFHLIFSKQIIRIGLL